MKKIPTVFERDWEGDKSRVLNKVTPGCEWVVAGEGVATRKYDGTCCLIKDGTLYKRRELKDTDVKPEGFIFEDHDPTTNKAVGWVKVGSGPEDKYHREAFTTTVDGTYELIGPQVQGNPEKVDIHQLAAHSDAQTFTDVPRDFEQLKQWLTNRPIEGLVFYHPDGRMAKIKLRDFGLKRPK